MIVDSDVGTDPDDTIVAIVIARAGEAALMVTNDETTALAKARFATHVVAAAGGSAVTVAAGLPSNKQRVDDLADKAGLVPALTVATDAVDRIIAVLAAHDRVDYIGLGALTNLDAALARRPELAARVRLFQMGPAVRGGFSRERAQYNARIDPGAFKRVLERVPLPTLIATHTTWGAPAPAPPLGVYPGDPLATAIARSERPDLRIYTQHLAAFVESGKDCSIMHDPATLLAAREPELFDLVELDVVLDDHGWLHLTRAAIEQLAALPAARTAPVASALAAPPADGPSIRVRMSLACDHAAIRARVTALLGVSPARP